MEFLWLGAVVGVVTVLATVTHLTSRSGPEHQPGEGSHGSTPERDPERSEMSDPAQFGQVTPGAVTPAAAGSSEQFYASTGVGSGGPHHLSGPPPVTPDPRNDGGWDADESRTSDAGSRFPVMLVAAAGGTVGLAVAGFWRWRARRKTRLQRLRERGLQAASVAGARAAAFSGAVSDSFEELDPRARAGGGAAVAAVVLLYSVVRHLLGERHRSATARLAAEAATAAQAARRDGRRHPMTMATTWLAEGRRKASELPTAWRFVGGCAALAVVIAALRGTRREAEWASTPSSGREPPATY